MPVRDGTGPAGLGRRTGRALGNCDSDSEIISKIPSTANTFNSPNRRNRGFWQSTFSQFFGRRRTIRSGRRLSE